MGNRFSSLPIAQYCPNAARHSAQAGAGRSAAVSSAFHARCSRSPDAQLLWHRLTAEEQEEMSGWHKPTVCHLDNGVVLDYDQAKKEVPLGLAEGCQYVPKGDPEAITEGTCDLYWIVEHNGYRIAYVPDIKRSEYTVADGPESLQIVGYALAVCDLEQCDGFVCGVWGAVEGAWSWGELLLWGRDDARILELWYRVRAAALHTKGDYAMGPHCRSCYGRRHCPAWMLPPEVLSTSLAPFAQEGHPITPEHAARLVLAAQQAADLAKTVLEHCREYAATGGAVADPATGKVWRPVAQSRSSLDKEAIEAAHPGLLAQHTTKKPSESYRWTNPPKVKKS